MWYLFKKETNCNYVSKVIFISNSCGMGIHHNDKMCLFGLIQFLVFRTIEICASCVSCDDILILLARSLKCTDLSGLLGSCWCLGPSDILYCILEYPQRVTRRFRVRVRYDAPLPLPPSCRSGRKFSTGY